MTVSSSEASLANAAGLLALAAISSETDLRTWSAAERDQLRWKLVSWRDAGQREHAEAALRLAARQWPAEPVFLLELLVLQLSFPELDLDEELRQAPAECLRYPEIALLLGRNAMNAGFVRQAREFFDAIGDLPRERMTPFAPFYRDLLQRAYLDPARGLYAAVAAHAPAPLETVEAIDLMQALALAFVHADRYENLFDFVRAVMYFEILEVPSSPHLVLGALKVAEPLLSVEGRVVHLELIGATYSPAEALTLLRSLLDEAGSRGSSRFARLGSVIASRLKDGALEREILCRFAPTGDEPSALEAAQRAEIAGRRRALGIDRPLEIFIGFFGQMREPEVVLPLAVDAIKTAFSDQRYGGSNLHFSVSTWPKTGGRTLSRDDATGFFAQSAPAAVRELLTTRLGSSGHALATRLPNLVSALVDHSERKAAREVAPTELQSYLPPGAIVVTSSENEVQAEVRPALARTGRDHPAIVNQFKMWSRIAALRDPLLAHEKKLGRQVDICLLIRSDLANVTGSLSRLAARAGSQYEHTSVFYDYDPHAEFIAGSGDRYILGSRASITALFGGYAHYLNVLRAEPVNALSERLDAHSGLQSLIVLNGLIPAPVWALGYELHRGGPDAASLATALQSDYDSATDPDLRSEIAAVLSRLAPQ